VKNETKTMHLFAGHGGGLLADLILGHRPVVAVEWDSYACQVLRERAADGWFPGLRVWEGDVSLFDPSEYTESVDIIHAGFPCQDISVAGKQAGVSEGTRSGLYREVLRIAGVVRPKQLFLENVSAILSNGLGTVLGDLAALGYDTRWLCIRASDIGAPHHRDRWFLLASHSNALRGGLEGRGEIRNIKQEVGSRLEGTHEAIVKLDANVSNTECQRQQRQRQHEQSSDSAQGSDWQATQFINGGASDFWSTESDVGRVANGIPNRVHRLKGLGNAQVPIQAAAAYRLLGGL
jgi:DNA (cytosine-5)-methyltransferase 1